MALPGHSPPPPFAGPGSPTRILKGHVDTQLPPMYGPPARSMLPASPSNYRFPNPPPMPAPSPSLSAVGSVPPYKRPGSSMSISSMLGGEPEKSGQELYHNHNSAGPSRQGSISAPAPTFSAMSPPQQPTKSGPGEYTYKPRSQSPDKLNNMFGASGSRQRSSSSGTPLTRPAAFVEGHNRSASTIPAPAPRYFDQPPGHGFNGFGVVGTEQEDRARRTSLSGILQRPNSQPQVGQQPSLQHDPFRQTTVNNMAPERQIRSESATADPFHRNGTGNTYDIKPPGSHIPRRPGGPQLSPTRRPSQPASPEIPRSNGNTGPVHTLASILNGPPSQLPEPANPAAQRMLRQDSTQSSGDRSVFNDRGKPRQYSPFASSFTSQPQMLSGVPIDEQGRKGSDELTQHRVLLSLSAENKRGRYSPMPQVMQGAQAHTPVPDAGVKTEHGRVFSGLGGGVGTTPTSVSNSIRKDGNRTPLGEDHPVRMSRNTPGTNKRSRKLQDDDAGGEQDVANGYKASNGRASKKGKYQHQYRPDHEEQPGQGVRNAPLTGLNPNRDSSTLSNTASNGVTNTYQSQHARSLDTAPMFKPKKTIRVATVFNTASKAPRKHLGNFTYRPEISPAELGTPSAHRFDVSIKPNLLPSFSAAEHVNCTYTIHVPRLWLQERERGLICAQRYLWGSGIYTDDSDPLVAAIHAGFIKASFGDLVDTALLARVMHEQNPRIEWPNDLKIPDQPLDMELGKDLNITMVVLPLLERYEGSARFGVKSRTWPEGLEKTQHDGVSFGILSVDFVNVGSEEMKMGRTGASRRQRLRMDLEARQRGLQMQKERIARAKLRRLEQARPKKVLSSVKPKPKPKPTSVPIKLTNSAETSLAQQVISAVA